MVPPVEIHMALEVPGGPGEQGRMAGGGGGSPQPSSAQ